MKLIAAFLWTKSPRVSISTMIFDLDTMAIYRAPKIQFLPKGFFAFRKAAKKIVREFFADIKKVSEQQKNSVTLEFKITFPINDVPYLLPAKESVFVFNFFMQTAKKAEQSKEVIIKPQLRQRLKGNALKQFKRELRSMYLVSRRKDTHFEYHLWSIALHATKASYAGKLYRLRNNLRDALWSAGV